MWKKTIVVSCELIIRNLTAGIEENNEKAKSVLPGHKGEIPRTELQRSIISGLQRKG
jgi:hypothetical protein